MLKPNLLEPFSAIDYPKSANALPTAADIRFAVREAMARADSDYRLGRFPRAGDKVGAMLMALHLCVGKTLDTPDVRAGLTTVEMPRDMPEAKQAIRTLLHSLPEQPTGNPILRGIRV